MMLCCVRPIRLAVFLLAVFLTTPSLAAEPPPTLAPVEVIGTFANPATGRSTMNREILDRLPAGNGSVNEQLRLFPDVRLSETYRSAAQIGEILPPQLSISGGKPYQNSFQTDGLRNDSLLDPGVDVPYLLNNVPGHPEELFPEARLMESLSVYDSNIPARYGGFNGGVVVVETRNPGPVATGGLFYRTTRNSWAEFHLQEDETEPTFEKHHAGVDLSLPLGGGRGVIGSYSQLRSRFPNRHLDGSRVQRRRLENLFLKGVQQGTDGRSTLSFLATPYEAENFLPDVKNSDFTQEGGGMQVQLGAERFFTAGTLEVQAGYGWSENSRRAPAHLRNWQATDSRPWGRLIGSPSSVEGGFGDVERTQETVQLRSAFLFEPLQSGRLRHEIEAGLEYVHASGTFDRQETTRIYEGARLDPGIVCGADGFACIDGEQYFAYRRTYAADAVTARVQLYDLFLEDRLGLGRLTLRPGVRLSYDDFMENLNVAPRLAATWDLFGDGATLIVGGRNRYYGRTILAYKLREAQRPYFREYRGIEGVPGFELLVPQDWEPAKEAGTDVTRFSRLDTPYTDEWVVGIDQALYGGRLSLKYVERRGRDEFARQYGDRQPSGLRYYTLTNEGRSRHESWRLAWERSWARHYLGLNATWQESSGSNDSYDDYLEETRESSRLVWSDDRLILRDALPSSDADRPWTVNLIWVSQWPKGFSFTNITHYRSGYRVLVREREQREIPEGEGLFDQETGEPVFEAVDVYRTRDLKDGVTFDWLLSWRSPGRPNLRLTLEVENVFNTRMETGGAQIEYLVGRQVWLGAEVRF